MKLGEKNDFINIHTSKKNMFLYEEVIRKYDTDLVIHILYIFFIRIIFTDVKAMSWWGVLNSYILVCQIQKKNVLPKL
jgi:hypothetical protein